MRNRALKGQINASKTISTRFNNEKNGVKFTMVNSVVFRLSGPHKRMPCDKNGNVENVENHFSTVEIFFQHFFNIGWKQFQHFQQCWKYVEIPKVKSKIKIQKKFTNSPQLAEILPQRTNESQMEILWCTQNYTINSQCIKWAF